MKNRNDEVTVSLKVYETNWLENIIKMKKIDCYSNPSLSFYASMVYGFANHLPYSMDIMQPEYVPADFLNMSPFDVDTNPCFKFEDRRNFFNSLVRWGDTFKTGMLLQFCNIFQKMLLGQFPVDYEISKEYYYIWGVDKLTKDEEYNRYFFETLKSLPNYYDKVEGTKNNEERRCALEEMYSSIMAKISARYGGFKQTDCNGTVVRETKGVLQIKPSRDIEMFLYWDNVVYHDGIESVISEIKNAQLKNYKDKNGFTLKLGLN